MNPPPAILPFAAGYLPGSAVSGDKAQAVTNCSASKQAAAGLWFVTMPESYDPTKHIITAMVTGIATSDDLQVEVGPSGVGLFLIQAMRGTPPVAANESIHFVVHKLPVEK